MNSITITTSTVKSKPVSIMDRVKSFEDACNELGISGDILITYSDNAAWDILKSSIADFKLKIIAQALNEGWKPDWNNSSEKKYYAWWNMQSGFVLYNVDYDNTYSTVGSRLCFKSETLVKYAATQFIDLYKESLTF